MAPVNQKAMDVLEKFNLEGILHYDKGSSDNWAETFGEIASVYRSPENDKSLYLEYMHVIEQNKETLPESELPGPREHLKDRFQFGLCQEGVSGYVAMICTDAEGKILMDETDWVPENAGPLMNVVLTEGRDFRSVWASMVKYWKKDYNPT